MKSIITPERFLSKIEANKRVSRLNALLDITRIRRFFGTINYVNNMDYTEEMVNGRNIADWKIPEAFRGFFLPRRLVVVSSTMAPDLLAKEDVMWSDDECSDYDEFIDTCAMILNALRRDGADNLSVSLKDVRVDALLSSEIHRIAWEGRVHSDGAIVYPLEIKLPLMKLSYFNEDLTFMAGEFMREWFTKG